VQQRLDLLTLGVRDLQASRRFYVEGLGWEPTLDLPEIVFIQVNHGLLLGLFPAKELEADVGERPEVSDAAARFTLAHNVGSQSEVDEALERVEPSGGSIVKPAQPAAFGGYHAYVADPDGFRWEIAYNPGWRVSPDGRVSIVPVQPRS